MNILFFFFGTVTSNSNLMNRLKIKTIREEFYSGSDGVRGTTHTLP